MKIAILSPLGRTNQPAHGGIETVARNLANEFSKENQVDLLVYPKRGQKPNTGPIKTSVNIISFKGQHKQTLAKDLISYSQRNRPDILLTASARANLVACRSRPYLPNETRLFISEHNTPSEVVKGDTLLKRSLRLRSLRKNYRRADCIIAVSRGVAEDLKSNVGLNKESIKIIHNPIVNDETPALANEDTNHPWFRNNELPVILGIGRLAKQKDFPTLLKAFANVHNNRPSRLIILGEGKERKKLIELAEILGISRDFDLPGFVINPYAYLQKSSVFVLSSSFEGFGNVVAEALAVGAQVVSTDCPHGPREILDNGRYGYLVPVGDVNSMAHAIQHVLDNPFGVDYLYARARLFSTQVIANKYLDLFSKSCGLTINGKSREYRTD